MAADGSSAAQVPRQQAGSSAFVWVSSSPSPAEVSRLESCFPEVVQVPLAQLEEEIAGWQQRAVLVRSFSKWVPTEAYIREFRRAGIPGVIEPVSLASRCHIFRFEAPAASDLVLNRPWVINGQVIGTAAWTPEFFPADDSVASALIWLRLPNLPVEFWKEEILRAITASVGEFYGTDSATKSRSRGGYARVAIRVNLSLPLRPGTRVQGIQGPFWQQFVFESLDGICSQCGSLHLQGSCMAQKEGGENDPSSGSVFGPWMSAVRRRREGGRKLPPRPSGSAEPSHEDRPAVGDLSGKGSGLMHSKLLRRRSRESRGAALSQQGGGGSVMERGDASFSHSSVSLKAMQGLEGGAGAVTVDVPVVQERAGFPLSAKVQTLMIKEASLDSLIPVSTNPFASLGLDPDAAGHLVVSHMASGPLKRARPAECVPPRSIPKPSKSKSKGKGKTIQCRVDVNPSLGCLDQCSNSLKDDLGVMNTNLDRQPVKISAGCSDGSGHLGSGDIEIDLTIHKDSSSLQSVNGPVLSSGSQNAEDMLEDSGGVQISSN